MQVKFGLVCLLLGMFALLGIQPTNGQFEFEKDPINYESAPVSDAIFQLGENLKNGSVQLEWDEEKGWLPSLLSHLEIPASSQTLVFSKTSLQLNKISPSNPRALYFNDDAYVGFVPGGDLIELSAVDSKLGAIFYSISQIKDNPEIKRDRTRCMTCHGTSKTKNVPGYLVRSVYAGGSGHPHYGLGTITTDHRAKFRDRFGGWYVTGNHGDMRHRGNVIAKPRQPAIDVEKGANMQKLPDRVKTDNYLTPTSDIVALMLLEHQSQMHNSITNASYETRRALHDQQVMNKILKRPEGTQSESTARRIASAAEKLLEYMLFCNEYQLESPVESDTPFTKHFIGLGPRDSDNRSLRDFDLQTRMFKYPCSFLIYSESFDHLPEPTLKILARRLHEVLSGEDQSKTFSHLSLEDRTAIREILIDTKPEFARRWGESKP